MKKIENDCCGCALPCIDCGRKRTPHYYCDRCGDETKLYNFEDEQLCKNCLIENFTVVEGSYE